MTPVNARVFFSEINAHQEQAPGSREPGAGEDEHSTKYTLDKPHNVWYKIIMAKIKYGDIVTEIRGARGGAVYSKNKYGYYVKPNAVPINKQSNDQMITRAMFLQFTKTWGSLTAGQRQDWEDFAAINPVIDSLGNTIYLTGANWYLKLNLNRTLNTAVTTVIEDAPADTAVQTCIIPWATAALSLDGTILSLGNIDLAANMVTSPTHRAIVEITPPIRPGQVNVDNMYRYFAEDEIVATNINVDDPINQYNLKVGDTVSVRMKFYNTANGSMSTTQSSRITVTAA